MEEAVVVVDLRFTIQYANKNAVRMLKLSEPVSSSGQHLKDFFEPEYFELLKDTARGGYSHSAELSDIEVLPKNSKKSIPVEISASRIVSDNKKSNADGYIFVISDVSALQQAYAKLAEQEKRVERKVIERTEELYAEHAKLEVSIAGLPIGLIMLDDNLEIIESNRVAKDLFEFRGNSRWYVAETLKDLNLSDKFTEMVVSRKTTEVAEMMIGGKTIHVIFAPITTAKDDLIGSVIIVEDISSRKAAEIERNEFIVTASHEIRTPLTVIQGNLANVIDDQDKIDKKLLPLVKNAHQASNRISNLFNDVLIIADIESEARPKQLYLSKFSLKDLMLEVVAKYKPSADAKKLQLSLSGVGDKWKIKGDRDEISEAIGKLVDNAIKFTKSGFVKISLSKEKGSVVVRIADSGRGISKEEEPRLFKKFVRLDNSLKRDVGGTGLGLYIAKSLAERNGGELILEKSSKTGSTFKLSLPI